MKARSKGILLVSALIIGVALIGQFMAYWLTSLFWHPLNYEDAEPTFLHPHASNSTLAFSWFIAILVGAAIALIYAVCRDTEGGVTEASTNLFDPGNPLGFTNPVSPLNPLGLTNPVSPNDPIGFTNPVSPNNPASPTSPLNPLDNFGY